METKNVEAIGQMVPIDGLLCHHGLFSLTYSVKTPQKMFAKGFQETKTHVVALKNHEKVDQNDTQDVFY